MYKREVLEKIRYLYNLAVETYKKDPELSRKYIFYLLKIKSKFRLYLPKDLRNRFCNRCYTVWIPNETVNIRIRRGKIIYHCKICNYVKRYDIRRKKKNM